MYIGLKGIGQKFDVLVGECLLVYDVPAVGRLNGDEPDRGAKPITLGGFSVNNLTSNPLVIGPVQSDS